MVPVIPAHRKIVPAKYWVKAFFLFAMLSPEITYLYDHNCELYKMENKNQCAPYAERISR